MAQLGSKWLSSAGSAILSRAVATLLLTPYHETEFHRPNFTKPPPDLIDGEEEYEIEEILQSRKNGRGCKVQYLVKWKGYPDCYVRVERSAQLEQTGCDQDV